MTNSQQGFARTSILIVSFITLLIAAGWILLGVNSKNVDEEVIVATSTDETTDWKTYRNEEFGFEFKHPALPSLGTTTYSSFGSGKEPVSVVKAGRVLFYIADTDKLKEAMLLEMDRLKKMDGIAWCKSVDVMNDVEKVDFLNCDGEGGRAFYGLIKGQKVSVFVDGYSSLSIDGYDHPAHLIQLLSTFKFIDPIDISDWKTYKNEEYGFEIKYSQDVIFSNPAKGFDGEFAISFVEKKSDVPEYYKRAFITIPKGDVKLLGGGNINDLNDLVLYAEDLTKEIPDNIKISEDNRFVTATLSHPDIKGTDRMFGKFINGRPFVFVYADSAILDEIYSSLKFTN